MLDKNWIPSTYKCFNPPQAKDLTGINKTYKNLNYITKDLAEVFENKDRATTLIDIEKQCDFMKKELAIFMKYNFFNKSIEAKILEQYKYFYLYEGYYYNKGELKQFLTIDENQTNTFIKAHKPQINTPQINTPQINTPQINTPQINTPQINTPQINTPQIKPTLKISTEAIRKISGYSPWVIPAWDKTGTQHYIKWQDILLQDDSKMILLDGSRQLGKSITIAEKAVELSFLPSKNTLVGGFIKKTTDVIRDYILKGINNFPKNTFEHFKSEGYILNTKSGSKIYFRTLGDGAENVLGLTLHCIIADEAQLIETAVFEDVLEPTLATTDGQMILIGTPGKSAKGYYYELIMEAKKNIEHQGIKIAVKSNDTSYYQVDYTQNPLINPRLRKKIEENLDKASIQRQYLCRWDAGDDQLFQPELISNYPTLHKEGYITITFDPARKGNDRSAFTVTYTYNRVIYIILSGFVPKAHKSQWSRQISFYTKGLLKQFKDFPNSTFGVDLRGLGEGFTEAWKNHFKNPEIPTRSLIEITYTSGDTTTTKGLDWRVSKTILISNAVDYIDEGIIKVVKASNKDLIEEMQFCYEDKDRRGYIAMKSTFKDDIINSTLTNLYIIHNRGFLKRLHATNNNSNESLEDWNDCFKSTKNIKKSNSIW